MPLNLFTGAMRRYAYGTLEQDEIRVLVLNPGNHGDTLRGHLEIISLSETPRYKAISYAWGEPVFPQTLQLADGFIPITESLYGALCRFRSTTESVRLWADACCIDQNGLEERNHQVNIMARIFAEAEEVLVWLGEASAVDAIGVWMLEFLAKFTGRGMETYASSVGPSDDVMRSAAQRLRAAFDHCKCQMEHSRDTDLNLDKALTAFAAILNKTFFSRLWVVQEIALAASARYFCGQHEISFQQVFRAVLASKVYLQQEATLLDRGGQSALQRVFRILNQIAYFRSRKNRSTESLLYSLVHTFDLSVSEPRDRIFAIRALASIQNVEALQPDYSLTLPELWRRATVFILANSSSSAADLEPVKSVSLLSVILAIAGLHHDVKQDDEPSWVPNLARSGPEVRRKFELYQYSFGLDSAGGMRVFRGVYNASRPRTVSFSGIVVDRVNETLEGSRCALVRYGDERLSKREALGADVRSTLVPWYLKCLRFIEHAMDGGSGINDIDKTFRELVTYDQTFAARRKSRASRMSSLARYKKYLEDALQDSDQPHDIASTGRTYMNLEMFLQRDHAGYYIDSTWVLASTSAGRIGWIPEHAQRGDKVCILKGAPFPFVVRDRDDGYYTLIGDAYIRGIMQGKAWPENEEDVGMIRLK